MFRQYLAMRILAHFLLSGNCRQIIHLRDGLPALRTSGTLFLPNSHFQEFKQNFNVDAMTKQQVESQLSRLLVQLHLLGSPTTYQSRGAKYSLQMQTVSRSTYLDLEDYLGMRQVGSNVAPNNVLTQQVDCRFFSILVTVQQNMMLQNQV